MAASSFGEFLSIEGSFNCISCHKILPFVACSSSMLRKSSGDDVLQIYSTEQTAVEDDIACETPAASVDPSIKPAIQPLQKPGINGVNGAIVSFQQQQQYLRNTLFMNHTQVSVLCWHPTEKILVIGCKNGSLLLWIEGDNYELVDLKNYKPTAAPITAMAWNESTNHLAVADQAGSVVVCRLLIDQKTKTAPKLFPLSSTVQSIIEGTIIRCISLASRQSVSGDYKTTRDMFLIFNQSGQMYTLNENCDIQDCSHRFQSAVASVVYDFSTGRVLVITEDFLITQFTILDTKLFLEREVKLSFGTRWSDGLKESIGRSTTQASINAVVIDRGVVAISYSGGGIRLLDYLNDESADVTPQLEFRSPYRITCLDFDRKTNCLVAGVDSGHLLLFSSSLSEGSDNSNLIRAEWDLTPKINIGGLAETVEFGVSGMSIVVKKKSGIKLIGKQIMKTCMAGKLVVSQTSPSQVSVIDIYEKVPGKSASSPLEIRLDDYIKDMFVSDRLIMFRTASHSLAVHHVAEDLSSSECLSKFSCPSTILAIDSQSVFIGRKNVVDICNFQGIIKQTLQIEENNIQQIKVFGQFLTVLTTGGYVRIFDLSRREARLHAPPKNLLEAIGVEALIFASANGTGSIIGLIGESGGKKSLFFYDVVKDLVSPFDLDENVQPVHLYWDFNDPRLAIIEIESSRSRSARNDDNELLVMWVAPEYGAHLHNRIPLNNQGDIFIGINTPYLVCLKRKTSTNSDISSALLSDFEGIDFLDSQTVRAVLDFGFNLNIGNLDEALKCAKYVKGYAAWNNISKTCVHSGRIDIAKICLGSIGKARALYAIRSLPDDNDLRLAQLAICLGMQDYAEKRLTNHEKELAKLLQMEGKWEKALEMDQKISQIKFKKALFKYAKYLEEMGDLTNAIIAYEKSGTSSAEVPRMLLQYPDKFHEYFSKTREKSMRKWYGAFLESSGSLKEALAVYESCHENLAAVRIMCQLNEISSAKESASRTGDPASCFHLARYFESSNQLKEAVEWFANARCLRHAVRIAKQNGMNDELMKLALTAKKDLIVEVAKYFEESGNTDKAASLYFKGGDVPHAVQLCFQTKHYAMLEIIAAELPENVDIKTLEICCQFFLDNKEYGKAAQVLVRSNKVENALRLCVKSSIVITEDMADKMLERVPEDSKQKHLLSIADACDSQGSFQLASKKYTQAGDRLGAIKALIKSGDVEKVKYFASISGAKQPEIFVIAANFLQTQNWHENGDLLKSIIAFYTKAKAFESLAGFYELCAQAEIDDYSNYEKALAACKEALKCLARPPTGAEDPLKPNEIPSLRAGSNSNLLNLQKKTEKLHLKIDYLTRFVNARKSASSDFSDTVKICSDLLHKEPRESIALAIRIGDIYGLVIEGFFIRKETEKATELLREMLTVVPGDTIKYYVDTKILESLLKLQWGERKANGSLEMEEGEHIAENLPQ